MEKSAKALTAGALAVVAAHAVATASQPSILDLIGPAAVNSGTGLTASDLVVGVDGTVQFDAKAHRLRFVGNNNKHRGYHYRHNPGEKC